MKKKSFIKRLREWLKSNKAPEPRVIPRPDHIISRSNISEYALKVLYRLKKHGYAAYVVGGGVRDLLLDTQPKDFDIATNARPEDVQALFSNCRLIGRRFRLAHVFFGRHIVEVATFRALPTKKQTSTHHQTSDRGRIVRDNVFGTMEEDAFRRDFTINALYYSIKDFSIVDFTGGMADIENKLIRIIGDPKTRYCEDPVRMLRAVRFAAKLDFSIEAETEAPLRAHAHLLRDIPAARLFEESLKLFFTEKSLKTYRLLEHYHLLSYLFPATVEALKSEEGFYAHFLEKALANTDARVAQGKKTSPAFLFATMLWPAYMRALSLSTVSMPDYQKRQHVMEQVLSEQQTRVAIPRRFSAGIREIWQLQWRLQRCLPKRVDSLINHPRFRAANDFLMLRAEAGEDVQKISDWWSDYYEADRDKRARMVKGLSGTKRSKRRRRPKRPSGDAEGA